MLNFEVHSSDFLAGILLSLFVSIFLTSAIGNLNKFQKHNFLSYFLPFTNFSLVLAALSFDHVLILTALSLGSIIAIIGGIKEFSNGKNFCQCFGNFSPLVEKNITLIRGVVIITSALLWLIYHINPTSFAVTTSVLIGLVIGFLLQASILINKISNDGIKFKITPHPNTALKLEDNDIEKNTYLGVDNKGTSYTLENFLSKKNIFIIFSSDSCIYCSEITSSIVNICNLTNLNSIVIVIKPDQGQPALESILNLNDPKSTLRVLLGISGIPAAASMDLSGERLNFKSALGAEQVAASFLNFVSANSKKENN